MFTIAQIKDAHGKVKSGADFPNYVQDLIKLGVCRYETHVDDGHTVYYGKDGFKTQSDAGYVPLTVAGQGDPVQFRRNLKAHQEGHTDYPTFCSQCAKTGVEKWMVEMSEMTCIYFDKAGHEMLTERIPVP